MSIKKSDRILVFQKCGGHCAYCGKKIELEEMQVDHIHPKRLGGKDELENYHPSCRRCNHYKRTLTLEKFRKLIETLNERLQKIYIVKVAIDYGIVTLNKWDGKFYFEREKIRTIKLTPPSYSITAELENGSKVSIPISLGDLENGKPNLLNHVNLKENEKFNFPNHYDFKGLKRLKGRLGES